MVSDIHHVFPRLRPKTVSTPVWIYFFLKYYVLSKNKRTVYSHKLTFTLFTFREHLTVLPIQGYDAVNMYKSTGYES